MVLEFGKDSCPIKGRLYSHGAIICNEERCIECDDGEWEEESDWSLPRPEVYAVPGKDFSEV